VKEAVQTLMKQDLETMVFHVEFDDERALPLHVADASHSMEY